MSKMFVHFNGTLEDFKKAENGYELKYTNHIVFIKGGDNGDGAAIYTHGEYFGNVKDALAALQAKVNNLKYFSKISDGKNTASVSIADGTINFSALDPSEVSVDVTAMGVKIGLSDAFKTQVNTTLPGNISAIDAKLGEKDATAATGEEASAFARIANLEAVISDLTGGSAESVSAQITNAINTLDVAGGEGDFVASISQVDGKIVPVMGTFNFDEAGSAAAVAADLASEVTRAKAAEEANAAAIKAEKDRMDAFMLSADVTEKAVDTLKEIQEYIASDGAAAQEMLAAIEAAATQVALNAEIERAGAAEKANADAIDAIEADYLKAADKTELQGNIDAKVAQSAYDEKIAALEAKDEELAAMWEWEEI